MMNFFVKISFILFVTMGQAGQVFAYSEEEIKAAYIYNFTKFVTWPESKAGGVNLCLYSSVTNPAPYLSLAKKIRVQRVNSTAEMDNCHILYLGNVEENSMRDLSRYSVQNSILLVGDGDSFIDRKGMFGLVFDDNKIGFEVNYIKIKEAKLNVSSKLMGLAKRVLTD